MSSQDETWDRPTCNHCKEKIYYGEKQEHLDGKCMNKTQNWDIYNNFSPQEQELIKEGYEKIFGRGSFQIIYDNKLEDLDIQLTKEGLREFSTRQSVKKVRERVSTYTPEQRKELDDQLNEFLNNSAEQTMETIINEESEGTKIAAEGRALYQVPVDVTIRLRQGDLDLLKSYLLTPPTDERGRKWLFDLNKLNANEFNATLVRIAVMHLVNKYVMDKINPSV